MHDYLERALKVAEGAAHGMTAEELARRPAEGKWSAAEILEHLSRAFSSTVSLLNRHLTSGSPADRNATWPERERTWAVIELGMFPNGRPAPEFTVPKGISPREALPRFRETLAAMDEAIARCEARFGGAKIASHAIFGPLTARQWRKFHWVHTRHHAKQIRRVNARLTD